MKIPIISYTVGQQFSDCIESVLIDAEIIIFDSITIKGGARKFTVSDSKSKVVLLVGFGDTPQSFLVRMSFREGPLRWLFHGERSLELAKYVETILRMAPASDILAQTEWLVPDQPDHDCGGKCKKTK